MPGPHMVTCKLFGETISIEEALTRRGADPREARRFRCVGCGERVRAHREASDGSLAAHFEHLEANPDCPCWN